MHMFIGGDKKKADDTIWGRALGGLYAIGEKLAPERAATTSTEDN